MKSNLTQTIGTIEKSLVKISNSLPPLPKKVIDWLYENIWWIVAIVAALGALSVLSSIGWLGLLFTDLYMIMTRAHGPVGMGTPVLMMIGSVLFACLSIAATVVAGMAIVPLKEKQKRGWDLLFVASLISAVVAALFVLSSGWGLLPNLFNTALGLAIGWYFLFQIRSRYTAGPKKVSSKRSSSTSNK